MATGRPYQRHRLALQLVCFVGCIPNTNFQKKSLVLKIFCGVIQNFKLHLFHLA
jgi:hypothetical protein